MLANLIHFNQKKHQQYFFDQVQAIFYSQFYTLKLNSQQKNCLLMLTHEGILLKQLCQFQTYEKINSNDVSVLIDFNYNFQIIQNPNLSVTNQIKSGKYPLGIIFYRDFKKILQLYTRNPEDLLELRKLLQKRMNEINFTGNFKALSKIQTKQVYSYYQCEDKRTYQRVLVKTISKQNLICSMSGENLLINELKILKLLTQKEFVHLQSIFQSQMSYYLILKIKNKIPLSLYIQKYSKCIYLQIQKIQHFTMLKLKKLHQQNITMNIFTIHNIYINPENPTQIDILNFQYSLLLNQRKQKHKKQDKGLENAQNNTLNMKKKDIEYGCKIFKMIRQKMNERKIMNEIGEENNEKRMKNLEDRKKCIRMNVQKCNKRSKFERKQEMQQLYG